MSYCRLGPDSDVYVYPCQDGIACCWCRLGTDVTLKTPQEMLAHLGLHEAAGHKIPTQVTDRLLSESDEWWHDRDGVHSTLPAIVSTLPAIARATRVLNDIASSEVLAFGTNTRTSDIDVETKVAKIAEALRNIERSRSGLR